ncbi:MAG: lipopolysaccharide heptosyltransferase II [Candidatus Nealsonbacteria bacterium]|nr:lipopolysaccharide heptosyltransferase II [Candidatus Nealsonbacteria bacterium]
MNIALFLPNWLGDLVMATPTIRAISRQFGGDARLVGIMRPYLADMLEGTDWLDEQWFFDPRAKDPALRSWALARRMRRERIDLAVLLTNSLRSATVAWLGGARERIGYVRRGRGPLLTGRLYPQREGRRLVNLPMVDTYLALAGAVGCPSESRRLELATTEQDERSADAVFADLGLHRGRPPILLNSSGAYGAAKLWPIEHFGQLARQIVDGLDHDVLVLCGPKEREIAREVVRLADRPQVVSMAEQPLDLGTSKACIRRARLMVSTDSGPRHAAAALGLPVVTLYGPMLPVWGENPTQRAVNLMLDLDCIGCHKRTCPAGHHRCMQQLTVDMVFAEVAQLIEHREPLVAA